MRLRVGAKGQIQLPQKILDQANLYPGSYIEVQCQDGRITIVKIDYDPFKEASKRPDPSALDAMLKKQKEGARRAREEFEKRMRETKDHPPEIRPEDHPDFWR